MADTVNAYTLSVRVQSAAAVAASVTVVVPRLMTTAFNRCVLNATSGVAWGSSMKVAVIANRGLAASATVTTSDATEASAGDACTIARRTPDSARVVTR